MTPAPVLHRHELRGCAPRPLAAYLKALAVLRIVSEQADPRARGRWQDDVFVLTTRLSRQELLDLFLLQWRPSPFVSPWNKGSGLLSDDAKGVGPLQAAPAPRFAALREGIAQAKALTRAMEDAVQAERAVKDEKTRLKDRAAKERLDADPDYKRRLAAAARACKRLKDELQPECQLRFRGPALRWLRAAVVLDSQGAATFPALLGTGGNDGKLDFTNNAMQRLGDLFDLTSAAGAPRPAALPALRAALFAESERGLIDGGIGQFAPAASGGANASAGALGASLLNPWDLPLLLEGALLFTAGSSRRLGSQVERTVAPFSARSGAAGYASAALADESARGEQWLPLWEAPFTAAELGELLHEGRCQLGARASEAAVDVARAIARLGVARGVTAFERYGYIERNGKSNYAVPLGRFRVQAVPQAPLLDDLEQHDFWGRLRRAARADRAPASLARLERRLSDAVLEALAQSQPARWQAVLLALAQVEAQLVASGAFTVSKRLQPLPPLSPDWLRAADDGGPELRLALALAGAGAAPPRELRGSPRPLDPVRHYWLPLDRRGAFAARDKALAKDPRVVVHGRDAAGDLLRLLQRRGLEGEGARVLPLRALPGAAADLDDLMGLLRGEVDLTRTLWLARALAALDFAEYNAAQHNPRPPQRRDLPLDLAWAALRLCHLAEPLRTDSGALHIPVDPAVLRLLWGGEGSRAFALVLRRLAAVGVHPPLQAVVLPAERARRFALSLAFPIAPTTARQLAAALAPPEPDQRRRQSERAKEPEHVV